MSPWFWTCVIVAPTGEPIPGTEAWDATGAIRQLLGQRDPHYLQYVWDIAITQGYKIGWIRRDAEEGESVSSGIKAGPIVHGRGARWFV
jgi:hypothetical protein